MRFVWAGLLRRGTARKERGGGMKSIRKALGMGSAAETANDQDAEGGPPAAATAAVPDQAAATANADATVDTKDEGVAEEAAAGASAANVDGDGFAEEEETPMVANEREAGTAAFANDTLAKASGTSAGALDGAVGELDSDVDVDKDGEVAGTELNPAEAVVVGSLVVSPKASVAKASQPSQGYHNYLADNMDDLHHRGGVMHGSSIHSLGFTEDANPRFRPTMEDGHVIADAFRGIESEGFFAVYDGHGGRQAVELVNKHLHGLFAEQISKCGEISGNSLPRVFYEAYTMTDKILAQHKCHYVGTTAVTSFITQEAPGVRCVYTANAGDARAVLCCGPTSKRVSYDHKASDTAELQRVSNGGGFVAAKRVNGVLSVSRALGDHAMKDVVICAPHVTRELVDQPNTYLVLACDGLWDVMNDDEVAKQIHEYHTVKNYDVQQISKRLVRQALERGSTDNISVMVIRILDMEERIEQLTQFLIAYGHVPLSRAPAAGSSDIESTAQPRRCASVAGACSDAQVNEWIRGWKERDITASVPKITCWSTEFVDLDDDNMSEPIEDFELTPLQSSQTPSPPPHSDILNSTAASAATDKAGQRATGEWIQDAQGQYVNLDDIEFDLDTLEVPGSLTNRRVSLFS
ncbi:Protein phosphatase 2C-like 1 [Porphyridium purpureum]|uniref:Protein phosphatase 2C-like 1 n=1 Tax=Porphyridium purpureum TaxID=35688 RepID=A0A5J4YLA4_PORPP|nr:Protein phosphatase 2C-like 1 [Porphyridium purpureum]|eukprot:POR4108..scf249_10